MIARGLQFSSAMARANWTGIKTETRRSASNTNAQRLLERFQAGETIKIWQREAFRLESNFDPMNPAAIKALSYKFMPVWFEADAGSPSANTTSEYGHPFGRARAAMHMPKWASRAVLEVSGMRQEPLGDITDAGARAEGITRLITRDGPRFGLLGRYGAPTATSDGWDISDWLPTARDAYFRLYARVNKMPDGEADLQRMDKTAPAIVITYARRKLNILTVTERSAA